MLIDAIPSSAVRSAVIAASPRAGEEVSSVLRDLAFENPTKLM